MVVTDHDLTASDENDPEVALYQTDNTQRAEGKPLPDRFPIGLIVTSKICLALGVCQTLAKPLPTVISLDTVHPVWEVLLTMNRTNYGPRDNSNRMKSLPSSSMWHPLTGPQLTASQLLRHAGLMYNFVLEAG
jgi:hypothetical protein